MMTKAPNKPDLSSASGQWTAFHDEITEGFSEAAQPRRVLKDPEWFRVRITEHRREDPSFDINAASHNGDSIALILSMHFTLAHAQVFEELGADLFARSKNMRGCGILHLVNRGDMVRHLGHRGLDPNMVDFEGKTPLHYAMQINRPIVGDLLSIGANPVARSNHGSTPLHAVASAADCRAMLAAFPSIDLLLRAGARLSDQDHAGDTLLHHIAHHGFGPIFAKLREYGADLDATNNRGLKPIHHAVMRENCSAISTLVALGASAWGVVAQKKPIDKLITDRPLVAAVRYPNLELLKAHLKVFPEPSNDDVVAAKKVLKRSSSGSADDLLALLSSHIAKGVVERNADMAHKASRVKALA